MLHLDLYRIEDPEELEYLAIRDQFDDSTVLLVEWPDRGGGMLPAPDLVLDFGETERGAIHPLCMPALPAVRSWLRASCGTASKLFLVVPAI